MTLPESTLSVILSSVNLLVIVICYFLLIKRVRSYFNIKESIIFLTLGICFGIKAVTSCFIEANFITLVDLCLTPLYLYLYISTSSTKFKSY